MSAQAVEVGGSSTPQQHMQATHLRDVARSKEIPRAPVPVTTANASAADNTSQTPQRAQEGATASAAPEPLLETPRAEVDIPVGYVEDIFDTAADDDVNMENEMPSLIQEASEEDVGPAGPYEQDTDSDDEGGEEPPSKKAREVYIYVRSIENECRSCGS